MAYFFSINVIIMFVGIREVGESNRGHRYCMYVFNDRERTDCQKKGHIGAKIDLRAKFMGKYNCLVVF